MIQVAICDDEPFILDELFDRLNRYAERKGLAFHISCFDCGEPVLESAADFDMLFLDIRMKPVDGMEIARRLQEEDFSGLLIFTTVLKEAVFDSFEVGAFDYLVKPVEDKRLERTLDRAMAALESRARDRIVVKKGSSCQVIPLSSIAYCEIQGRVIHLHQAGGETIAFYEKMENFIKQVDRRFFRCHRSYLVNLDLIRSCRKGIATLSDGSTVPVSRLREQQLNQALLEHMQGRKR